MNNWIVDLNQKEQARGTALVFVPHAGGGPNAFRSVAREIRRKLPVYAICYPGHENRISEPLVDDFSFVAEGIAKAASAYFEDRPFAYFGHSMGASLAHEAARIAALDKLHGPSHLIVSSREAPSSIREAHVHLYDDAEFREELLRVGGVSPEVLEIDELCDIFLPIIRNDYKLIEEYVPAENYEMGIDCPVTAFLGKDDPEALENEMKDWANVTTGFFEMRHFQGGHFYFMDDASQVATALIETLYDSRQSNV